MHEIRRTVANSARSHYGRREIEALFELQPRAAGKLLSALPSVTVGTSQLLETEVLAAFLQRVQDADDVGAVLEQVRQEKAAASRKRLRSLVVTAEHPVHLGQPPRALTLSRGRVSVDFKDLAELAEAMYFLARALHDNLEEFASAYEPLPSRNLGAADDADVRELFQELSRQEQERCAR